VIVHTEPVIRAATREDIPRIRSILEEAPFGDLTIDGESWERAFEHMLFCLWAGGLFALEVRDDFSVDCHVSVLPAFRGRPAIEAATKLRDWLFLNTPCPRISGRTPATLRAAQFYNRALGFTPRGSDGGRMLFVLERAEWEKVVHG
jgi:hypothetical protein